MKFQGIYRAFMVPVHHTGMRSPFLRRSSAGSPFRVSLLTGLLIATGTPAFAPAQVGSVTMVALLYYLDHPHPFNSRTAVAPLAQQLESQ